MAKVIAEWRIINDGRIHGRRCYNKPQCVCPERAPAAAAYEAERRAKRKAEKAAETERQQVMAKRQFRLVAAPDLPATVAPRDEDSDEDVPPLGRLGKQVMREIEAMPGAVETYPGLIESCLVLAAMVDSGAQPQLTVSAVKEIKLLMADMRPAKTGPTAATGPTPQQVFFEAFGKAL